jgi:hypothetical protein
MIREKGENMIREITRVFSYNLLVGTTTAKKRVSEQRQARNRRHQKILMQQGKNIGKRKTICLLNI